MVKSGKFLLATIVTLTVVAAASAQEPVSFVSLVTVGDSLSSGTRNGIVKEEFQIEGWPSLVAQQIGTYHFLPLLPDPGFGQELILENGEIVALPPAFGAPSPRSLPLLVPQNLAVAGQDVLEALMVRPTLPLDSLEDVILGLPILVVPLGIPPASQVELAVGLQPTFTMMWLGANDVLQVATEGAAPTPLPVFQQAYTMAAGALVTLTDTRLVVANVPDVEVLPFLVSAEEVAAIAGLPLGLIGPPLGIAAGDFVRLPFAGLVEQILTGMVPGPLPPEAILGAEQAAETRLLVAQYNAVIAGLAAQLGFAVVDMKAVLREADESGFPVGDRIVTTDFLGGMFSLDAVHPTRTGQGIIAAQFIDVINESFGLTIPQVDLEAILASDPLAPPVASPLAESSREVMLRSSGLLEGVSRLLSIGDDDWTDADGHPLSQEEVWEEFLRAHGVPERNPKSPSVGWTERGKQSRRP